MRIQLPELTKIVDYDLIKKQLFKAVEIGDLESMKDALSQFDETGRNLRFVVNEDGQNILHTAARLNPEIAEWLCQNRTDFSPSPSDNPTFKYFYKLANFIGSEDQNKETPLDLAIKYGTLEKIPTLVNEILKHPVAIDFLIAFDKYNRFDILESLISQGLKVPDIDLQSPTCDDTITEIGKKGMIEVLKLCLKNYHGPVNISSLIENYTINLSQESSLSKNFTSYKSDKYDFGTLGNREVIKWLIKDQGYQQYIQEVRTMAICYDDTDMLDFINQHAPQEISAAINGDILTEQTN